MKGIVGSNWWRSWIRVRIVGAFGCDERRWAPLGTVLMATDVQFWWIGRAQPPPSYIYTLSSLSDAPPRCSPLENPRALCCNAYVCMYKCEKTTQPEKPNYTRVGNAKDTETPPKPWCICPQGSQDDPKLSGQFAWVLDSVLWSITLTKTIWLYI